MDARSSVLAAVSVQDLLAAFEDLNGISRVMKMCCCKDVVMYISSDLLMSAKCCRRIKSVSPIKMPESVRLRLSTCHQTPDRPGQALLIR